MRRAVATAVVLLLALAGYAAADVYDKVPGILTRDVPATSTATADPVLPAAATPVIATGEPLATLTDAPAPTPAGLTKTLAPLIADPGLQPSVGVIVRDALTGTTLYSREPNAARIPASTSKILTAAGVLTDLDPTATMATTVVQTPGSTVLTLVAGGDTLLGRGNSDPNRVAGRAGLTDLARQVRDALAKTGQKTATLRVDTTYAAGPVYAPSWLMPDVDSGATQGVFMIGFADQIPRIGHPSPRNPPAVVGAALAKTLTSMGIATTLAPQATWPKKPTTGTTLGQVESAPIGDVLAFALDQSDNALAENLCRQAAVSKGLPTTFAAAAKNAVASAKSLGINTTGVVTSDCSGLTHDQSVPVRVIADILTLATTGKNPALQNVIADLPVAGLSGTLHDRFEDPKAKVVAGIPRAKTGTLTGISGLAGTTVDADGRLLSYVIVADKVPMHVGTLAARAALDRFVAGLTACGCR